MARSKPTSDPVSFNFRMAAALHERLREIAFRERTTITALLTEAVEMLVRARRGK